jgi:hypothetical protein
MTWNLWTFSALSLALWWAGALAWLAWQTWLIRSKKKFLDGFFGWIFRSYQAILLAYPIFPSGVCFILHISSDKRNFIGDGFGAFFRAAGILLLPFAFSLILFYCLSNQNNKSQVGKKYTFYLHLFYLIPAAMLLAIGATPLNTIRSISTKHFIYLSTAASIVLPLLVNVAKRGQRDELLQHLPEMDESPLKDEVLTLAAAAGRPVESVRVLPMALHQRYANQVNSGWQPSFLTLSSEELQKLDAETFTAFMAFNYANKNIHDLLHWDKRLLLHLSAAGGILFTLAMFFVIQIKLLPTTVSWVEFLTIYALVSLLFTIILLLPILIYLTATHLNSPKIWRDTFDLWRRAGRGEPRSELALLWVCASGWRHLAPSRVSSEELLEEYLAKNRGLRLFVEELGRDRALEAMRSAMAQAEKERLADE